jgi:predicted metal-dependent HD superfamily phosphohydrolase
MDYLEARWQRLWHDLGAKAPNGSYQKVIDAYAEPHRRYHDITHITNSLELFDWHRHIAVSPAFLELSIWLHDVVYDVKANDNEARSADFAEYLLREAGLDAGVPAVRLLIESTAHSAWVLEGDAVFLSDIDLAVLGARQDVYNQYATFIRQEYSWVPESVYAVERSRVMGKFLSRPAIFLTAEFNSQYEKSARRNIKAEIQHLIG